MSSEYTPAPWHHHIQDGRSFILSAPHTGGLFLGSVIAMEGTNINAKADHARTVECVNACDLILGNPGPIIAQAIVQLRVAQRDAQASARMHAVGSVAFRAWMDTAHRHGCAILALGGMD